MLDQSVVGRLQAEALRQGHYFGLPTVERLSIACSVWRSMRRPESAAATSEDGSFRGLLKKKGGAAGRQFLFKSCRPIALPQQLVVAGAGALYGAQIILIRHRT